MENTLIEAINQKVKVKVTFDSKEKGRITRLCIPFDIGPSKRYKDGLDRYHFFDLDSPDGKHNLSVLPDQIIDIEITNEHFDPSKFITWTPSWFIVRDWGLYS
jgi:hypothetical protein